MNAIPILLLLLLASCAEEPATVPQQTDPPQDPAAPSGEITTFDDCVAAGYPIMESYPRQCRTPDGRTFVEQITEDTAAP